MENLDLYGIAALALSNVGMWLREWRKARAEVTEDHRLQKMDEKLDATITGVTQVEVKLEESHKYCSNMTTRFAEEIRNNREKIYNLRGKSAE